MQYNHDFLEENFFLANREVDSVFLQIVPAVCGINLARSIRARLLWGWIIATIGGIGGLFWSFYGDLPSGAAIVCTFGALLIGVSVIGLLLHSKRA